MPKDEEIGMEMFVKATAAEIGYCALCYYITLSWGWFLHFIVFLGSCFSSLMYLGSRACLSNQTGV